MNVIIIEDEPLAQAKLESMLRSIDSSITVSARLGSVKESIKYLETHTPPDLAFVDIQLSDDHSFHIFRSHPVNFPVIFTTAYDKYVLETFEFNSVDYLLKPVTEAKLRRSLEKIKNLKHHFLQEVIKDIVLKEKTPQKKRIVGKKGSEFVALSLDEVAYFYTDQKIVFARDTKGNRLILDKTLSDLESTLDKNDFFRLNRKFIAQRNAIDRFKPDNGKIRVFLNPEMKDEIHVSKESAPEFRNWIGSE
jgi:DNA-binding LytR/AlgR family response regulator